MTTQALDRPAQLTAQAIETVLIQGDLSKLTAEQRMNYYMKVCESLALNPLTKPFEYLSLNNKLVLYAKRDCTDQLRARDNVSVQIKDRTIIDGLCVVTAQATLPDGRTDESLGAVNVENLKGEAKANAMMKAETKAKRRVTLSICGLGVLDESEVESLDEVVVHAEPVKPAQRKSQVSGGATTNGSAEPAATTPAASPASGANHAPAPSPIGQIASVTERPGQNGQPTAYMVKNDTGYICGTRNKALGEAAKSYRDKDVVVELCAKANPGFASTLEEIIVPSREPGEEG